jgi:hypothetical protein
MALSYATLRGGCELGSRRGSVGEMKKALLIVVGLAWLALTACGPVLQPAVQGEWSDSSKKKEQPKPKAE